MRLLNFATNSISAMPMMFKLRESPAIKIFIIRTTCKMIQICGFFKTQIEVIAIRLRRRSNLCGLRDRFVVRRGVRLGELAMTINSSFCKRLILLTFILISGHVSARVKADSLSLEDAVALAFSADNKLMAARANIQATESGIKHARASYMPRLALTGSYYHLSKVSEFTIPTGLGSTRNIKTGSDNPFYTGLGLNYELYTFGRRPAGMQIARVETRRSKLQLMRSKKMLFDSVSKAYFTAIYADESLALVQDEKNRFEQIYELVESRFQQDLISEFDLLQTQLRLETYRLRLLEMTNNLQTAKLNLARLLDLSINQLPELSGNLNDNSLQIPEISDPEELYENREDYREAAIVFQMAQLARKVSKSAWFPTLSAFGKYDWHNNYQPDVDKIEGSYSFGLNFGWLLFDGFSRRNEIARQDYNIKSCGYLVDDIKKDIPNQAKTIQLVLENCLSRIEVGEKALDVARKSMVIAETRFEIGDLTMIELLEIENRFSQAEMNLLRLRHEYIMAQLDLKKASGHYPEINSVY